MSDLEKELARQIHELNKELMALRERVAVLELKTGQWRNVPIYDPYAPPYKVTCTTGIAGEAA